MEPNEQAPSYLGDVAPDSTHYIDAHDLSIELGELFQKHWDSIPESVHGALAIFQAQLEHPAYSTDPQLALDHLMGIFIAWLNPER